ncbi:hypothetical protein KQX54_013263 [Cotesia glomerata]|uniref:Uncharacterized protein n=1 Tax=Cotesia glomerata TaxID=32391 RepID=A0AAV7ISV5_COTGL|nr:hypothetical protein KQX54_013263 [Cotesia glomerata]
MYDDRTGGTQQSADGERHVKAQSSACELRTILIIPQEVAIARNIKGMRKDIMDVADSQYHHRSSCGCGYFMGCKRSVTS